MTPREPPSIIVLAGTNGAGKSSVAGETFRERGAVYFNPDEAARRILELKPWLGVEEANARAWLAGKLRLERAIAKRMGYIFETTLGGATITALLEGAVDAGIPVRMWYVGLATPEHHLARVRARVAAGGHDIPAAKVRERFDQSRKNLIRLLPALAELHLSDNTAEADPETGQEPRPQVILRMVDGTITETAALAVVPTWAKPILVAAFRAYGI